MSKKPNVRKLPPVELPAPRVIAFPLHIVQAIINALEKLPMREVASLHADIARRVTAAGYADKQRPAEGKGAAGGKP